MQLASGREAPTVPDGLSSGGHSAFVTLLNSRSPLPIPSRTATRPHIGINTVRFAAALR
jgi:hypothetical protein